MIVGSIWTPEDVEEVLSTGAGIVKVAPKSLRQMIFRPKTEAMIDKSDEA